MDQDYKNYLLDCETLMQRVASEVENENLTDLEKFEHVKQHARDFVNIRAKFLDKQNKKIIYGPRS